MHISIHIIGNSYIVNQIVSVEIEVVDPGILIIQLSFEGFQRFGFLEQIHYSIEVKIVTRKSEIFIRHVLGPHCAPSCKEECED